MTPEEIEHAAILAASNYDNPFDEPAYDKKFYDGFLAGADFALKRLDGVLKDCVKFGYINQYTMCRIKQLVNQRVNDR